MVSPYIYPMCQPIHELVIEAVSEHLQISKEEMTQPGRKWKPSFARQVCYFLLTQTDQAQSYSIGRLGRMFNRLRKDARFAEYSAVTRGIQKATGYYQVDPSFRVLVNHIAKQCGLTINAKPEAIKRA